MCVCVTIAERSGYSFCFSDQTDQGGFGDGGTRDGELGKGQIEEGGCEETFLCLSLN